VIGRTDQVDFRNASNEAVSRYTLDLLDSLAEFVEQVKEINRKGVLGWQLCACTAGSETT